jgi:transforming growth factor-beta-induced protein
MKKSIWLILPMLLIGLAILLVGCGKVATTPTPTPTPVPTVAPKDIVDTAVADVRFTTLVTALQAAGLVDTLKGAGPFTVFAPTNDAFNKLPAGTLDSLLKDIPTLKNVLLYHVVSGKVMAADVVKLTSATTVLGKTVTIRIDQGNVYINDAKVIITDIQASNGVIHVINAVLIPPKDIIDIAEADGNLTTLVTAIKAAGLVDTLKGAGPFTVFAPTNDAFSKLPAGTLDSLLKDIPKLKNVLLYHVVSGKVMAADVVKLTSATTVLGKAVTVRVDQGNVYINDAKVTITDIQASNGVIHIINAVLSPPA